MPKVGIITQARMTRTRLPGKVLMRVGNKSLLEYHIERLKKANLPIIIATTLNASDDPIADFCGNRNLSMFRGDEHNVLSRYYYAAQKYNLNYIVRVTSDCPLIDGELISRAVSDHLNFKNDWVYTSNCLKRTFARGFDFEIFSFIMLENAFENALTSFEKEHVTPYFYQNLHGKTKLNTIEQTTDFSDLRITVDEADDFKLIERLIIEHKCQDLNAAQISELLRNNPGLKKINIHVEQRKS